MATLGSDYGSDYWLDNGDQDGNISINHGTFHGTLNAYNYYNEIDEDILDKIDIKVIEQYLRKKKLEKINEANFLVSKI